MGMEIGSVKTTDGMVGVQRAAAQPEDAVSKSIQSEISNVERQRQGLSSKEGMSAEEKVKKRKELQQELSSLNTKLRQRQAEVRKEQQREGRTEALRAEAAGAKDAKKGRAVENGVEGADKAGGRVRNRKDPSSGVRSAEKKASGLQSKEKAGSGAEKAKENRAGRAGEKSRERNPFGVDETKKGASGVPGSEKKNGEIKPADKKDKGKLEDVAMPEAKMRKLMAADSAKEQKKRQETVIARMENDIVILKGEIKQDEARGVDTEQKKAQLKRQEEKVLQASSDILTADKQSGPIGEKLQVRAEGAQESSGTDGRKDGGDEIVIAAANLSKDFFQ